MFKDNSNAAEQFYSIFTKNPKSKLQSEWTLQKVMSGKKRKSGSYHKNNFDFQFCSQPRNLIQWRESFVTAKKNEQYYDGRKRSDEQCLISLLTMYFEALGKDLKKVEDIKEEDILKLKKDIDRYNYEFSQFVPLTPQQLALKKASKAANKTQIKKSISNSFISQLSSNMEDKSEFEDLGLNIQNESRINNTKLKIKSFPQSNNPEYFERPITDEEINIFKCNIKSMAFSNDVSMKPQQQQRKIDLNQKQTYSLLPLKTKNESFDLETMAYLNPGDHSVNSKKLVDQERIQQDEDIFKQYTHYPSNYTLQQQGEYHPNNQNVINQNCFYSNEQGIAYEPEYVEKREKIPQFINNNFDLTFQILEQQDLQSQYQNKEAPFESKMKEEQDLFSSQFLIEKEEENYNEIGVTNEQVKFEQLFNDKERTNSQLNDNDFTLQISPFIKNTSHQSVNNKFKLNDESLKKEMISQTPSFTQQQQQYNSKKLIDAEVKNEEEEENEQEIELGNPQDDFFQQEFQGENNYYFKYLQSQQNQFYDKLNPCNNQNNDQYHEQQLQQQQSSSDYLHNTNRNINNYEVVHQQNSNDQLLFLQPHLQHSYINPGEYIQQPSQCTMPAGQQYSEFFQQNENQIIDEREMSSFGFNQITENQAQWQQHQQQQYTTQNQALNIQYSFNDNGFNQNTLSNQLKQINSHSSQPITQSHHFNQINDFNSNLLPPNYNYNSNSSHFLTEQFNERLSNI